MKRSHPIALALSLGVLLSSLLAVGCGARATPGSRLSPDSYLPVSDAEMAEALRAPAVTCVSAPTPSGCAPDPKPPASLHPDPSLPASASQGVL